MRCRILHILYYFARLQANVDAGVLVTKLLATFNKPAEILRKHSSQLKYHKCAMVDMHGFIHRMEQHQPLVYELACTSHARLVAQIRLKLKSILKCVIWCARQNIALRGQRDDDKHLSQNFRGNPSNFKALLQFCVESGDLILKEILKQLQKMQCMTQKLFKMNI